MKVRMLSSQPASPDGITVNLLKRGEKYDLPDNLAQTFILQGKAEQDKDMGGAPEVKQNPAACDMPWGEPAPGLEDRIRTKKTGRCKRRGR